MESIADLTWRILLRKGIQDRYETYLSDAISNAARFSDQLGLSVDNTLDKQNKGKGVGFCWSAALDYLPLHVTVPLNDPEAKSGVGPVAVNVIVALVPQFPVIEMGTRTPGPHAPWGLKLPVNEKVTLFVDTEVIGPDAVAPGLKPTIVIVHVPCPAVIPPRAIKRYGCSRAAVEEAAAWDTGVSTSSAGYSAAPVPGHLRIEQLCGSVSRWRCDTQKQ